MLLSGSEDGAHNPPMQLSACVVAVSVLSSTRRLQSVGAENPQPPVTQTKLVTLDMYTEHSVNWDKTLTLDMYTETVPSTGTKVHATETVQHLLAFFVERLVNPWLFLPPWVLLPKSTWVIHLQP